MPRQPREKSKTGIYHVMLRGIDKREVFLKDEDYGIFCRCIQRAAEKSSFSLFAYCLMPNHIHLLIKEGNEEIGDSIRRISVGYVQIHNNIYGRTGHLFQNRFLSEKVENDAYLLVVLRYIHQNPVKAGLVREAHQYKWSSYDEYLNKGEKITHTNFIMEYFTKIEDFIDFNEKKNNDKCLDMNEKTKYTDEELFMAVNRIVELEKLKCSEPIVRDEFLKKIKNETGASARHLERILGISRNIILNAK